ncbi:MAG: alkaline shock response membrane anchor protein AmaP [Verrucomicrobiota bacterium]
MVEKIGDYLQNNIVPLFQDRVLVATFAILLLVFLYLLILVRRRMSPIRVSRTHSGRIQVSRKAIRELVYSAARHITTTSKPRVRLRKTRGKLHIVVRLRLTDQERLSDIASRLQTRVEDVLHDSLSIERRTLRIDVGLIGIRHDKHAAAAAQAAIDAEAETAEEPESVPVEQSVPVVKQDEDHFISTEDDPEPIATTPEPQPELPPESGSEDAEEPVAETIPEEPKPEKTRRGFFSFGRRKEEPKEQNGTDDELALTEDDGVEPSVESSETDKPEQAPRS